MNTRNAVLALICLTSLASPLQADLWMEHDIKVTGGDNLKMLSSEGTVQTWISDQKSRSEARMESNSKVRAMMGQNLATPASRASTRNGS